MRVPAILVLSTILAAGHEASGEERSRFLQAEVGWTEIHRSDGRGPSIAARVGRTLGRSRILALDFGLNAARADEGFVSGVLGVEARAFPRGAVSPFLRVETGVLAEESAAYAVLGGGGGLAFRLSDRLALRASLMLSDHGWSTGGGGPKVLQVGLEYRW